MSKKTPGDYLNEMKKYLYEEPTADEQAFADGETEVPNEEPEDVSNGDTNGEDEVVKIYFNDLTDETKETIINQLKSVLNVSEDDTVAENKLEEQLEDNPIIEMDVEEFKRKMGLKI